MSEKKQQRNGKVASKRFGTNSKKPPATDPPPELARALADVYESWNSDQSRDKYALRRDWFVFNMTDWLEDFRKLADLYENPSNLSAKEVDDAVSGFLIHAPHHIIAAARLLLGKAPQDIFWDIEEGSGGEE